MMEYYRRFIKDFSKIAKPLTKLSRGEGNSKSAKKINFDSKQRKCFDNMKQILSGNDILTYPDFFKPFCLTTDASDYALGAVLQSRHHQGNEKPIHFASRILSKTKEACILKKSCWPLFGP